MERNMDNTVRLKEFEKFYKALMSTAPQGYVPWFFPIKAGNKDPDGYCIALRANPDTPQNERSSWKAQHARLTYEEAKAYIINGRNIGIAARKEDPLHIADSDSEVNGFNLKGMMCVSRTRFGRHFFNWMQPELKRNIATDKDGEVRAVDQYVVASGSFVKVTEGDLKKKFEEGSITKERIPELLSDEKIGLYTYEGGVPDNISPLEIPEVFQKQLLKDVSSEAKQNTKELKKTLIDTNESKKKTTRLFDLKINDVCPDSTGRTSHPLHDSDTGTNWCISDGLGHCWRHGVSLNAYQYLVVEMGLAGCQDAGTKHHGSCNVAGDRSILLKVWVEAKKRRLIPIDDPVPYSCLLMLAGKHDGKLDAKEFNKALSIVENEISSGRTRMAEFSQIGELFDWKTQTEEFIDKYPHYYDRAGLWWQWNDDKRKWILIDETDILIAIDKAIDEKQNTLASSVKSQIIEGLRRAARRNEPEKLPESCVQFMDTIYDIETGETFEATSRYFNKNPIPWKVSVSDETPTFDRIFEDWVGSEMRDMLYEIIAFCTIPTYFLHRAFAFLGSGSNGKSKFLGIARTFVGQENCCDTDLEDIATNRFESSKMYGKLVAFMGETNFKAIDKTSRFKKYTGQDLVSFEFKNKNGFSDMNTAKMLISSNSLPVTLDKTEGFYRRWIIISFDKKYSETIDILKTIPVSEYENLAAKSLKIIRKLWKERKFTKEGTIEDRKKKYEEKSNPLRHFLDTRCVKDNNTYMFKFDLRDDFEIFCKANGYRPWSQKEVGSFLTEEGFESKQYKNPINGNFNWAYVGLRLKRDDEMLSEHSSQDSQDSQGIPTQSLAYMKTSIEYPNNPVNPVSGTMEDNLEKAKKFIRLNPKNNAWMLEKNLGKDNLDRWVLVGALNRLDPETYVF